MKLAIGLVIVVAAFLGLAFFSNGDKAPTSTVKQLSSGTTIYDVRTAEEYATGHAKDSILLPLADIQAGSLPAEAKNAPIALYCRSGNRSGQAAQLLEKAGYTDITDIGAYANLSKYGIATTN